MRVFLDGAFAFVLYKKECRELSVAEGEELSREDYEKITKEILPHRAKLRAMHLLEKRPYTEKGLRDKLTDAEYPEETIDAAIAYVSSYGYIDDARYARDYAETYVTRKSRRRILSDLLARGIDKACAEEAVAEVFLAEGDEAEEEQLKTLLRKKGYDPSVDDTVYHQKIYAFLSRKGFSHEQIKRAMREAGPPDG